MDKSFLKSALVLFLSLCVAFACAFSVLGVGDEPDEVFYEDGYLLSGNIGESVPVIAEQGAMPVFVNAKAALLMDAGTGQVLMAMNENNKLYPASVTKIMTLLLVAEAIDSGKLKLSDMVTTSTNASSKGGSQIWLKEGETMSVDDLLKATAIYSANDACTALGEQIAGSSEAFVDMMNERAKELGMSGTYFENCTGLDDAAADHLTTAHDIALMSRELLKHEIIQEYTTVWMDSLRGGQTELVNTNRLVRFYEGTTGLKTGTTSKAGCCVAATAKRGDTHLIAVVMGSPSSDDRFEGAKAMLNWGFSNYETVTPEIDKSLITEVAVIKGIEEKIKPSLPDTTSILIPKGRKDALTQEVTLSIDVEAPVEKGQVLGRVVFRLDDEIIGDYNLTAPAQVGRLTMGIIYKRLLNVFSS
ncbi:MAG: D-alanyl-D-alanine carboxypeptidase [Clostridiales bacterium]|jgi:D-alanyl-D-alanine carboxypeptidase (penicillin-binding protein 5/6)|nr:D-alanyl-D-alanine carboxypeptidase [Clostridiales bacterium]